jgi:RNA polymerase sigma factor (sigma-70 family)
LNDPSSVVLEHPEVRTSDEIEFRAACRSRRLGPFGDVAQSQIQKSWPSPGAGGSMGWEDSAVQRPASEQVSESIPYFDPGRAVWLSRHILPHEPALRHWLLKRRQLPIDVDDLIQESYAKISGLKSVAHIDHPKAYFFQTAQSLILRQARRAKVISITAVESLDVLGLADELSPERQVAGREELRLLNQALATFPSKRREAFRMRKVEGLSQKEIAVRLGVSEKAVEKHVAKAVSLLINLYGRGGKIGSGASMMQTFRSRFARDQTRN